MQTATLHRNFFQRMFGICATKQPSDEGCWTLKGGKVIIDLSRAPELSRPNGAMRLEKKNLPEKVLVIQGDDGQYYAFRNRCTHGGRRLDPIPEEHQIQCCSVGKSIFDYKGKKVSGKAKEDLNTYTVTIEDSKLIITL